MTDEKRSKLEDLFATWSAHWPVPDLSPPPELEESRAAYEWLGRSYLGHIVRVMLEAPSNDPLTVSLQAKMLKAAMSEAVASSDEIGMRVLDAFAEP
jgi:hypothetical protein